MSNINDQETLPPPAPKPRGFAALRISRPELFAQICSAGGKAAHAKGTAHEWTPESASEAGRKGGRAAYERRTGAHRNSP